MFTSSITILSLALAVATFTTVDASGIHRVMSTQQPTKDVCHEGTDPFYQCSRT